MDTKVGTLIKRYETSADTFEKKGKKYYAYAKNGRGDEYFGKAKYAYKKATENRQKAQQLKATYNGGGSTIKPEDFLGNVGGPMIGPGMAAAGVRAVSECAKAIVNGDSCENATSNVVSKSMETAVNVTVADVAATAITSALAITNPIAATAVGLTTAVMTAAVASEITDGAFDGVGKEVGRVTGNIGYTISEGTSEFASEVKRIGGNIGWGVSNAFSNVGFGIKRLFS